MCAFLQFCTFCWYNFLRNVDLYTLNKRAANYLRALIFAILLSFAEINTREKYVTLRTFIYLTFYNPLPFVVTSLFYTLVSAPPDTGGWLAHAQAVDTRPTSLTIVQPGIESNVSSGSHDLAGQALFFFSGLSFFLCSSDSSRIFIDLCQRIEKGRPCEGG